jgi:hypothetical protein
MPFGGRQYFFEWRGVMFLPGYSLSFNVGARGSSDSADANQYGVHGVFL